MMGLWHEAKHPVKFWSNLKTPKFWAFLESEILCSKIFKFFFEIFRINNIFLDNFFLFQKFFKIFKILNFFFKKHQKWNARDFNFFKFSIPVTWGFQNGMACSCTIFCDLIHSLKHCVHSALPQHLSARREHLVLQEVLLHLAGLQWSIILLTIFAFWKHTLMPKRKYVIINTSQYDM